MVSSSDGYCTAVGLEADELGVPYASGQTENHLVDNSVSPDETASVDLTVNDAKPLRKITPVRLPEESKGGCKAPRRVNFITLSSENTDRQSTNDNY